jgi:hypothetical protein
MKPNTFIYTTTCTKTYNRDYRQGESWLKLGLVMKSKWTLAGLDDYRVGEDNKIYRLPFFNGKKYYEVREVKMQKPKRYRLNGTWWSAKQLRSKLKLDKSPIILLQEISDCPF